MRSFRISEQSEIFDMRREAEKLGKSIGFSEEDCGRTAIIATELATNISSTPTTEKYCSANRKTERAVSRASSARSRSGNGRR